MTQTVTKNLFNRPQTHGEMTPTPRAAPRTHNGAPRSGVVIVVVLWAIAIAAVVVAGVQLFSHRQARTGYESLHRIKARWAAQAGIEQSIAVMADHTENPYPDDAFALIRDLEIVSYGEIEGALWDIRYNAEGSEWEGPIDEHAKMNINAMGAEALMIFDDMTPDVLDAVSDWMDPDSEVSGFGVERDYYLSLQRPYEPRNGPMRSIAELELVAGVWPRFFRGEDWNLNHRMNPNENDGGMTFPSDEDDGYLDAGWSANLTTHSRLGGATQSGNERLRLALSSVGELQDRLGVSIAQARSLIWLGLNEENRVQQLVNTPLSHVNSNGAIGEQPANSEVENLTQEQLRAVLAETMVPDPLDRSPGKINVNTVPAELLRDLVLARGGTDSLADEILYMRESRAEGITSLVDLLEIPDVEDEVFNNLIEIFTTHSNVFKFVSRGRTEGSNIEVEIIAVVDRSSLPVRILQYREQ